MKFRDLLIGDTFDFVDDAHLTWNSFYDRCVKVSKRNYESIDKSPVAYKGKYQVGSINCEVYHCKSRTDATKNIS